MKRHTLRLTTLAAALGASGSFSLAQTSDGSTERIEISARKRSEPLQEVPVAARTLSKQMLDDENVTDLKALAARTASASTVELGASFASEVILRGSGSGRAVNAETATGLYRNGAYAAGGNIGGRAFNRMDFFDVQRIEVMRGPQGALFGRGAVGGAMNIINVRPQSTATQQVTLNAGSDGAIGVEAIVNQPVSDALALRAGIKSSHKKGGTYRDRTGGAALDEERFDGARVSVALNPGGGFNYQLLVDGYSEAGPSFAVQQFVIAQPENRFRRSFNTPYRYWRKEWTVIGEGTWDLGWASVVALTQVKRRDAATADDFDRFNNLANANLDRWQRLSDDSMSRFGQELRIQNTGSGSGVQWLAGIEFLKLDGTFTVDTNGAINRARPNNSLNATTSNDTSLGVFGLLGYDLTPRLNATLELRQQNDHKKFTLVSTTNTFPTGTSAALQDTGPVTTGSLTQNFDRKFDGLAKVLALAYKASTTVNAYLRYGEAFRPGGFNNDPDRNSPASTPAGPRFAIAYEQEQAKTTELGLKTEWFERALRANAAAYRTRMSDILLNNSVSSTPPGSSTARTLQYIENGGGARIDGFELDMSLTLPVAGPGGRLIVDGSANITDSQITAGRFAGSDVPQTRPKQGSLGVTYEWRPLGLGRAFVNVNTQVLRGGFQQPGNSIAMDKVDLLNLNVGMRARNWFASLGVQNVNDFLYVTNYNNAARTTGYTNAPRAWSLKAGASF